MNIFLDVDDTLFDTTRLGSDTSVRLEKELGIKPSDYYSSLNNVFVVNTGIYSPKVHATLLAEITKRNTDDLVSYFRNIFSNEDSAAYLFPDTIDFVQACSLLGQTVILSFGEDGVQNPRITKSGLRALVTTAIVTQGSKAEAIADYLETHASNNSERTVLIDDSLTHLGAVHDKFPDAQTIHIVRKSDIVTPPQHRRATSLTEALEILRQDSPL